MPVNSKSIEFVFDNCFNVLPIILILFLIMFIFFFLQRPKRNECQISWGQVTAWVLCPPWAAAPIIVAPRPPFCPRRSPGSPVVKARPMHGSKLTKKNWGDFPQAIQRATILRRNLWESETVSKGGSIRPSLIRTTIDIWSYMRSSIGFRRDLQTFRGN